MKVLSQLKSKEDPLKHKDLLLFLPPTRDKNASWINFKIINKVNNIGRDKLTDNREDNNFIINDEGG